MTPGEEHDNRVTRRLWMKLRLIVAFMMVLCAGLAPRTGPLLYGQAGTNGTIIGTTTDASGAVVPGVTVVLKYPVNVSDREVTALTDEKGEFRFQAIPPGLGYTVRAELTGFRSPVVSNIEVRPGITNSLKLTMEVGTVSEEVSVTATSPLINLESSQISEGLSLTITNDLALRRRDFSEVAV